MKHVIKGKVVQKLLVHTGIRTQKPSITKDIDASQNTKKKPQAFLLEKEDNPLSTPISPTFSP